MNREQMELGLETRAASPRPPATLAGRRSRRFGVARWWFARMREVACAARDWEQNPWGPNDQIRLPLTNPPTRFDRVRAKPLATI